MFNLLKSVDKKLDELGFKLEEDNDRVVAYSRYDKQFDYSQTVCIMHKNDGKHIIQSYDASHTTIEYSPVVGLTYYETKLFLKKMKQKGWLSR